MSCHDSGKTFDSWFWSPFSLRLVPSHNSSQAGVWLTCWHDSIISHVVSTNSFERVFDGVRVSPRDVIRGEETSHKRTETTSLIFRGFLLTIRSTHELILTFAGSNWSKIDLETC